VKVDRQYPRSRSLECQVRSLGFYKDGRISKGDADTAGAVATDAFSSAKGIIRTNSADVNWARIRNIVGFRFNVWCLGPDSVRIGVVDEMTVEVARRELTAIIASTAGFLVQPAP